MTMIHDNMIKAYRAGEIQDIRAYDFKFNKWVWTAIGRKFPMEVVERPIDVGVTNDASFWDVYDLNDVIFVGHNMASTRSNKKNVIRTPIYKEVELEPSDYVFCIDQINNLSREGQVVNTLYNLMTYSKKYVILTCWAYDVRVPTDAKTRKKHFWQMDNYVTLFEERGFRRFVRVANPDAINMLYIFKKL